MSEHGSGASDRWSALETPEAVADAVERLRQMENTASEVAARRRFLELLAPRPGEHALDVGAGLGRLSLEMARHVRPGGTVTALDPSQALLDIAGGDAVEAGVNDTVRFEVGDARTLPHGDGGFDLALCHWVLLHVDPAADVVSEMKRVLRPGGRMMCVEVDWETLTVHPGAPEVTRRIVEASVSRQVDGRMGRKLVSLFRRAGLTHVRVEPMVGVDTEGDADGWLPFVESRVSVAVDAGAITRAEGERWWKEVREAVPRGDYFFSVTQFAVLGRHP